MTKLISYSARAAAPASLPDVSTEPQIRPYIVKGVVVVIGLAFGGFGIWASLAPLSSAAVAPGSAKVDSYRKTVQHLEGGIIREILVRNGDAVKQGQVLVRLDDGDAEADKMRTYGPQPMSAPTGAIHLHVGDNIAASVAAAPVGATFYFEPGVYRGVRITPKSGQTFLGADGAILNGSELLTGWTQRGSTWVVGGQTQKGLRWATQFGVPGFQRAGYPETVFVDNLPLKPVDALSKVVPGTFYFDYAADKIYIGSNPAGHTVEAGKLANAFASGLAQNVIIQNLVIEKFNAPIQHGAIKAGQGWVMENNEVRLNYGIGISVENGGNNKIIGNFIHNNGEMATGGTGNNILVENNEFAYNGGWSGISAGFEGGAFKFGETDGLIIRGNYSHDNIGPGMWTDISNIRTLYENNVVVNNTDGGIYHEISYDAIIRNNVVMHNGRFEIAILNSKNADIYGNKIDMTGSSIGLMLWEDVRAGEIGAFGPYATTGNHIHDNIFVDRDNQGTIGGSTGYSQTGVPDVSNTWDNNHYYMTDGADRFQWGITYNLSGFESHTTGSGSTISQVYPNTADWLNLPTDSDPLPPPNEAPPP